VACWSEFVSTFIEMLLKNLTRRHSSLFAIALLACLLWPGPARRAATLQELLAGATIDAGNARFSNWQLTGLDASGTPPDLALINVTPVVTSSASPGLHFASLVQLAVSGANSYLDLSFSYRVEPIGAGNSFAGHAAAINGLTFGGPGGFANLAQDTLDLGGAALGTAVAFANAQDDVFQFTASATHAPHLTLTVNTNIFLHTIAAADSINFTAFTQTFAQTGPTTIAGDFNNDKGVDGRDFLVWQRGVSPAPLSATDLAAWRANFGQNINAAPTMTAVPEPGAAWLAATAAFFLSFAIRRCVSTS
jgi:hypothetical protein